MPLDVSNFDKTALSFIEGGLKRNEQKNNRSKLLWIGNHDMTFRYIGSKSRLVDQIKAHIGPKTEGFFVDAFCGTGVVAEAAAELGWAVRINDHLLSAVISTRARLISREEATFQKLGGYRGAISKLNALPPTQGFMWRSYSPASVNFCGLERRYFTEVNAGRIDSIRAEITEWFDSDRIDGPERTLLIADLFSALNRVANIAGTFGCFLSKWTAQSQGNITLQSRNLKEKSTQVEASVGDVFDVPAEREDVVYLDPPYTKRQYASYYHILETVAIGDSPEIEGVAGLRPWKDRSSDFCYKVRALDTLERLIGAINAHRILLSYSSEGHIAIEDLKATLTIAGTTTMYPMGSVGRYRPNRVASSGASDVREYLAVLCKSPNCGAKSVPETPLAQIVA